MNITEEMLEKAIEIEGLVRILRDRAASPETYALLEKKCGELHSWAKSAADAYHKSAEEVSLGSAGDTFHKSTVDDTVQPTSLKSTPASIPESAVEFEEADDLRMEEAEREETASEADDDILLTLDDDDDEPEPEATPEPASEPVSEPVSDAGKAPNYKSRFSLNDRFLYARELFNGDMKMFDASIRAIEGVKDFSVVEDYFYNELDWNREDPTVKAFMDTLAGKASY